MRCCQEPGIMPERVGCFLTSWKGTTTESRRVGFEEGQDVLGDVLHHAGGEGGVVQSDGVLVKVAGHEGLNSSAPLSSSPSLSGRRSAAASPFILGGPGSGAPC
ncbi:hypothetical protein CRUP_001254 [Coryphaenoides rupestris]|nr:hypothetical protein CRUP_001254 [Coryphaenoides rupestris]